MRLKTYSQKHKRVHQFTIIRYFQERFLYRLSKSKYRDNFLLKGGALVYYLSNQTSRYTKDVDLLLKQLKSDHNLLKAIFTEICEMEFNDGVIFVTKDLRIEDIQKEGLYTGTRIKVLAKLGNIKHQMQIDIGTGDYVTPRPQEIIYPTLLDELEPPKLKAYTVETVISEKFEAMIALGEHNSRMKDFYDVYQFLGNCKTRILEEAIENTFRIRKTPVIPDHPIFTDSFYQDQKRVNQWRKFLEINELEKVEFGEIGKRIQKDLKIIYENLREKSL
ncbi:MAG TPA: nucleotidyl transferase AbiEii/AbiGii toxin family protein [Saprospiraceae bacterium]|nr:nucleotidyl transferase AbiEii/AbiGii toxin family protein [Saprospiraceae bacterium]